MPSEQTIHEFRPTWAAWFWQIVLSFGLLLPWVWWRRRGVRYEVTPDRVIKHTGRLRSHTDEFQLSDVSRIRTSRSVGEKLLGGGTIVLDTGVDEMTITAIPDHASVADSIRSATSQ